MKSPYVNDLQPNQTIQGTFLVAQKEIQQKKSGEPYLSLTLADRTGELDAKMWDNAAEVLDAFDRNGFVQVKGMTQVFKNRLQLTIHKLQPVPESEVELGDYLPASKRDRDEMFRELQALIAGISNPHLKGLLDALFADEGLALAYRTAPAAKSIHHGWIGGLLEHVLSLCQLAKMTSAHYAVDFDLVLTGVILHDIGKVRELEYSRSIRYGDEGQLLGHIHIGIQMVAAEIAKMPDFPPRLRDLLLHMILSHHGQLDYGSPKVPMFPEAMLLHLLDNMDSKMELMRGLIERDPCIDGNWTSYSAPLERSVLKKDRYLNPPPETPKAVAPAAPAHPPASSPGTQQKAPQASLFGDKLRSALK